MNIFSNLRSLIGKKKDDNQYLSDDEVKAARIKFHRDFVRNGPTPAVFGAVNGRAEKRQSAALAKRRVKKARRKQVSNFLENDRLAATVRGQLQLAGVLPYVVDRELDPVKQIKAAIWINQRFGTQLHGDKLSWEHDDVLHALGEALGFYGRIVGLPNLQVPAGYVVPVYYEDVADSVNS